MKTGTRFFHINFLQTNTRSAKQTNQHTQILLSINDFQQRVY